jgi:hypothetical protein
MGWLQRSQAVLPAARGQGVEIAGENESPDTHDSPALVEILAAVDAERPQRILDLGQALSCNLERYSAFASGVRIANLLRDGGAGTLGQLDESAFRNTLDRVLPVGEEPFGIIFAWDIFNYLIDDQPSLLARHLAAVAADGARIHAMIVTTDTMPAEPSRFELLDGGRLIYRPTTDRLTAAPDTPPALVERWLEPFRVQRSFLLRHGVREFIAVN